MTDLIVAHLSHLKAAGYAETTVDDRNEVLSRLNRDLPYGLEHATVEELANWLAHDGWSTQTRATYYTHIRGFFGWACDPKRPILDWDPSVALTRPRVPQRAPRPTTDQEVAYALAHAVEPYRTYVVLAAYAGLRCCEITTIERRDITPQLIMIRGKGGKESILPTHPQVWETVQALPGGRIARPNGPRSVNAKSLSTRSSYYLQRTLGLEQVTLHRYRHWYGTTLLNEGANLRVVQELMRHSSPTSTAIYTLVTDKQRQVAVAALPSFPQGAGRSSGRR